MQAIIAKFIAKWQRRRNVTPHQRHLQQIRVQGVRAAMQLLGNEIFDEAQQKHAPGSDHQVPIAQCDKLVAMCAEMNGLGLPAVHAR